MEETDEGGTTTNAEEDDEETSLTEGGSTTNYETESGTEVTATTCPSEDQTTSEESSSNAGSIVKRNIKSPRLRKETPSKSSSMPSRKTSASMTTVDRIKNKIKRRTPADQSKSLKNLNGEVELERTPNLERRPSESTPMLLLPSQMKTKVSLLTKEIQSKNDEIKELKLKLKMERQKIKDVQREMSKGQKVNHHNHN